MIGYATIGANDLERAKTFYDKVLEPLGGKRIFANERMQFYGGGSAPGMLAVCKPYDEQPASVGNGSMFGLNAATREAVDAAHAAAVAAGATCEGQPGLRTETFYGAYFRDLDGNKICVFKMG
ncbi:VOC family protein [Phenylobacterium sp. J367]|uniref:VOC family protein n=1 Tax=Phenylobacterium sp. J367 TaxID=2898435 RepID=UPI002151A3BA|nr:VOC family protein [Phenylobacterium sp. J367]MCR5881029.1 VOC family protein [Phenylobacterium sp. J367]